MSYSADLTESIRAGLRLLEKGMQDLDASLKADGVNAQSKDLVEAEFHLDECEKFFTRAIQAAAGQQGAKLADSMKGYDSQETT